MAWTLVAHTGAQSTNTNGITTAAIDTTGATLLVMAVGRQDTTDSGVSDSKGNTWVTLATVASGVKITIYYVKNATVGSGHTFSTGADASSFPVIAVQAWSGNDTTQNVDQANVAFGATGTVSTLQPGSVTPSQDNELLVSACVMNFGTAPTVGSGFTNSDGFALSSGLAYGMSMSYFTQSTAAALNPTYTASGNANMYAGIGTFKISAGTAYTLALTGGTYAQTGTTVTTTYTPAGTVAYTLPTSGGAYALTGVDLTPTYTGPKLRLAYTR